MAQFAKLDITTARAACVPCRRRKRKCTKDLRGCSTCIRLGCRCFYDQTPRLPFVATEEPSTRGQSILVLQHSTSPSNNATCWTESYHLPAGLGVSSHDCTGPTCQSDSLFAEAIKLAGPLGDIKQRTSKYFASIHIWLPVISRLRFYDTVGRLPRDLSSRTAWILLGCTMRMIAYVPHDGTATDIGNMNESLYKQVKRLLLLTELECKPSLDLVQAWLLMASYEIGHGLESAAYLSIGSCARLAILLGLEHKFDGGANSTSMEEKNRTWWGIVIVERHINLAFPHRPLITSDPEANGYLPANDDKWDDEFGQSHACVPMTTSSDVPAGPFAREAQAATLLGRTLTHITKPTPDVEFNVAESRQLDRTLTSFLSVLPAEDVLKPCSAYCGAMGICTSALLLLHTYEVNHQHNLPNHWHNFPSSQDAIGFCCDFVIKRAAKYTSELATVDIDSLSPFAPYAIYQASVLQYRLLAQSGSNKHRADIRLQLDMLEEMLASFSRRWGTAGEGSPFHVRDMPFSY